MIEKSEIASKELEKYMDINLINRIQKILSFKYRGFFQIHKINFYKICHEIIEKRNDEMFIFNKITVIVLFEIGSVIKKFEFFYYKNFDKSQLIDYDVENVEKSSKAFTNFLFNLKNFLNSKMCLFEDVNLHYSNFYSKNLITIDAYYSRITYYYFENDGSYIDLVKKMCEMVKKVNGEYNLYKFTSKSYKEFESLFFTVYEYNDQNVISNMIQTNIENLVYEENTYYLLKIIKCEGIFEHICILPKITDKYFFPDKENKSIEVCLLIFNFAFKNVQNKLITASEADFNIIKIELKDEHDNLELFIKKDENNATKYLENFDKKSKSEQILWVSKCLNCKAMKILIDNCTNYITSEGYDMLYYKKYNDMIPINIEIFDLLMYFRKMEILNIQKENIDFFENDECFDTCKFRDEKIVYCFSKILMVVYNFLISEYKNEYIRTTFEAPKKAFFLTYDNFKPVSLESKSSFSEVFKREMPIRYYDISSYKKYKKVSSI
ncbi:hypothetical protein GVAV_001977 [Gurleya vavrai]